jgi:hypothetical protein
VSDRLSAVLARVEAHGADGWTVTVSLIATAPAGARWECTAIGPGGRRVRVSAASFADAVARACALIEEPRTAPP